MDSLFSLEGKLALVTGGGSGLGASIATTLSNSGAKVASVSYTHLTLPTKA